MNRRPTHLEFKFPGTREALDGNSAVVACEIEASDAAGAYPITPSTQMGEGWAEAAAAGHLNISDRPLIFIEPEGEHAAAAVTAGLSMTGLRSANFSSGQGIAYMHESLYAAVGKRLTYVLNMGCRAMTKSTLNVHAGHDDYHCVDDTGFFQLFGKNAQAVCDLNLIAHKIAELALNPGIVAQDGFLTTHLIESLLLPEREMIAEYLGRPDDEIECPTPAQRMLFGPRRRRIPALWDVDNQMMFGLVQNQDAYMQSVAAQRPFFFDHIAAFTDQAMGAFYELTGRAYRRVMEYRADDAEYLILGQGSLIPTAEAVADYLRESRGLRVGVIDLVMFRPFPGDLIARALRGKKGVAVLERVDQPLAEDQPLMREIRSVVSKCLENGHAAHGERRQSHGALPFPEYEVYVPADAPALYSGSYGLGSRDLQPEAVIAAVENMLPEGGGRRSYYLSIDFVHAKAFTPKQEVHQQALLEGYPHLSGLALKGSENPNLMPPGSVTVRLHSVGGWGAITTGKNLALTLFHVLGYHIKANPRYGSEKKGQPTTFYLAAAPEPIRVNCEYIYVDAVLSPDPNVFSHTNALAGLRKEGIFIIQSEKEDPAEVWAAIPARYRSEIQERKIRVFFIDAFQIARREATDVELQYRMQGNVFQGAFFAASGILAERGLDEARLFQAIEDQLRHKFGAKGERVVQDNLRSVRRGFLDAREISPEIIARVTAPAAAPAEPPVPAAVRALPVSKAPLSDIHRFWEQTGNFYASGQGGQNLADPFIALSVLPASTGLFRDMTGIRFEHPEWIPENCTGCGDCWSVCPDTAIPAVVNDFDQICTTAIRRLEILAERNEAPAPVGVRRHIARFKNELRRRALARGDRTPVRVLIRETVRAVLDEIVSEGGNEDQGVLQAEFERFAAELHELPLALTRPFFTVPEGRAAGSGGLLAIAVNPNTCKGCMECVQVCRDDALRRVPQTEGSVARLRRNFDFWKDLPDTPDQFIRVDDLEAGVGALETLLLKKSVSHAVVSGDGACLGCTEKTVVRLFAAAVEALMQPRARAHSAYLDGLIARLEEHMKLRLAGELRVSDEASIQGALNALRGSDLTLAGLAEQLEHAGAAETLDPRWVRESAHLIHALKELKNSYENGTTGRGRASMGMLNATGCTSVWGSTFPYNPYPFPWANHLFQDAPSLAMGVFEGHMAKMADGFKLVRRAEAELAGQPLSKEALERLSYFNWRDFTDDEWHLCPPVVALGGDGAMYDIGFQNLSRLMISGKPIKVVIMDTQVYSNTGGQACTSGFFGQISDMAAYGRAARGKQEIRKEIALIGMAHRNTYVMQSSIASPAHMLEGFIAGLRARRPAVFNIYCACQPEHGIADDAGALQARLALESRAYPYFRYDPAKGDTTAECFDLEGNPEMEADWPTYTLRTTDDGAPVAMELPMTFADFAATEGRFRKHFRTAPPDTWNEKMITVAEYLELAPEEREGRLPFVWAADRAGRPARLMVGEPIITACEDRRQFWRMLRALAGRAPGPAGQSPAEIEERVRREVVGQITGGLLRLAGSAAGPDAFVGSLSAAPAAAPGFPPAAPVAAGDSFVAARIDSEHCTACDECIKLNRKIFAYDANKKAYVKDPRGGPYGDLVKAAERCTASVIHPGLPADPTAPGMAALIKRAEKYSA